MKAHTNEELKQWQALPLSIKIRMSYDRIRYWINEYGTSGVYVSFSGGKDSAVLSHLIDQVIPNNNIPRVFVNTGLEYPELLQLVKKEPRIVILKPKMNFRQVIEKYGYPLFSKENSLYINQLQAEPTEKNKKTRNLRLYGLRSDGVKVSTGKLPKKLLFMIKAPFKVSNYCCDVMKKEPLHRYSRTEYRFPFTGEMACESRVRARQWLKYGCNGFYLKEPKSTPLAFWTEQDILQYIKDNNIIIPSVYGDIKEDENGKLCTTGCKRTGCVYCCYGFHLEKPGNGRFEKLKITHPTIYEWVFKDWNSGGLGYKKVIDWINENGNMNIKY